MNPTQKKSKENSQDKSIKLKSQPIQGESESEEGGRVGEIDGIILMIENWRNFGNIIKAINGIEKKETPSKLKLTERFSFEYWDYHILHILMEMLGSAKNSNYIIQKKIKAVDEFSTFRINSSQIMGGNLAYITKCKHYKPW